MSSQRWGDIPRTGVGNGGLTAEPTFGAAVIEPSLGVGAFSTPERFALPFVGTAPFEFSLMMRHARAAEIAERTALARKFAQRAYQAKGVQEIRLTVADDELIVTALTDNRDMERDLALQRLFAQTSRAFPGVAWSLRVRVYGYTDFPEDDGELLA